MTGLSLSLSVSQYASMSLYLPLSRTFFPLYISVSSHHSPPIPPPLPSPCFFFPFSSLSHILLSTGARAHPYKSFNPVLRLKISFCSNQVENSVNASDNTSCFQCKSICVQKFLHLSATLESGMTGVICSLNS